MLVTSGLMAYITENPEFGPGWVLSLEINGILYMFGIPGGNGKTWLSNWYAFRDSKKNDLYGSWQGDFNSSPLSSMKKVDELSARMVLAWTVFEFPWLKVSPLRFGSLDSLSDNDILKQFDCLSKQNMLSKYPEGRWNYMVNSIREVNAHSVFDRPVLMSHGTSAFWNV